jgi:hypothetical protein
MVLKTGRLYFIRDGEPVQVISILIPVFARAASVIPLAATVLLMVLPARLKRDRVMGSTSAKPVIMLEM